METIVWALSSGTGNAKTLDAIVQRVKDRNALLIGLFIIDPKVADVIFRRVSDAGFLGGKPSQNLHAAILRDYKDRAHRRLEQFKETAQKVGIRSEGAVQTGEFAEVCARVVKDRKANLLILGDLSRYSFYQFLSGQNTVGELEKTVNCQIEIIADEKS